MKLVHRTGEKQKDKKDILKKQIQDKKHGTSKGSKIKKEIVTKNKGKQRSTDKKIRKRKFITPPKPNINPWLATNEHILEKNGTNAPSVLKHFLMSVATIDTNYFTRKEDGSSAIFA
ncbi:hypothetical protein B5X24_HaOG211366 [Helicoverpa armigera]|nr:hypothetical protein B5X24_HaOG211366 [Helicoverpa armigera]